MPNKYSGASPWLVVLKVFLLVAVTSVAWVLVTDRFAHGAPRKPSLSVPSITKDEARPGGRLITVANPTRSKVYVVLSCAGIPQLAATAIISPKRRVVFDLQYDGWAGALQAGDCWVERWHPVIDPK